MLFSLPRLKIARGSAVGHLRHKLERDDVSDGEKKEGAPNRRFLVGSPVGGQRQKVPTARCMLHIVCLHQGIRNENCRAATCEIEGQIVKMSCDASIARPLLIKSLDGAAPPLLLPAAERRCLDDNAARK